MKEHDTRILKKIESCKNCLWYDKCKKYNCAFRPCEDFSPVDEDDYCAKLESYLHENIKACGEKRLRRHARHDYNFGIVFDNIAIPDEYYCQLVNDSVAQIRKGHIAYVFYIDQVIDCYRLEPRLHIVAYKEGIYYLTV